MATMTLKRFKQIVKNGSLNLEKHCNGSEFKWYGHTVCVMPLHCSYGVIGYSVDMDGKSFNVDNELGKIEEDY